MPVLELELRIAAPRTRCFDLARSIDAHVRSTRQTSERAIAGRTSGLLELNEEVTWRARHFGVPLTLTSRITAFDRPSHFRDEMVRGPLARLKHDHWFLDAGNGGTLVRERFDFASPLGLLGRVADAGVLARYFRRFLDTRNRELQRLAESEEWRAFVSPEGPQQ
jgi:ligand-binding SRPBCC domain-containing protein